MSWSPAMAVVMVGRSVPHAVVIVVASRKIAQGAGVFRRKCSKRMLAGGMVGWDGLSGVCAGEQIIIRRINLTGCV